MNRESSPAGRWQRVQALFDATIDLAPAARAAYLHGAAADNGTIEAVLRLASVHDNFTGSEDHAGSARVAAVFSGLLAQAEPGHEIAVAGFRVERLLGEGGMGLVYLATREVGGTMQRVALKLAPFALRGERMIARLRREGALLAGLEHPNIARFIDAGELPNGRPYFAMEYVDGVPITRHCDERSLGVRERLTLFRDVCEAVAYAHRRLVLHRDIKAGNILVDTGGRPRLVDFGIGKSLDLDTSHETTIGSSFFTLASAAPEQVLGAPTSVSTDVYGLGCLLYDLLAGCPPFPTDGRPRQAVIRAIVDEPPALMSTAAQRPDLRGDLDVVAATALRKDPADRYRSVDALIGDIDNILALRPIAARRSERRYRLTLFLRRNRVPALLAVLLGAAVVTATIASIVQSRRAEAERDRAVKALAAAQLQRDHAQRVTDFLTSSFEAADPVKARGRELRADELLDSAVRSLEQNAATQDPALRATIAQTLAHLFFALDRLPDSLRQARIAQAAVASVIEPAVDLLGRQGLTDAEAAFVENRYRDAAELAASALARLGGEAHAVDGRLLYDLWIIRCRSTSSTGDYTGAIALYDQAITTLSQRADVDIDRIDRLRQRQAGVISDDEGPAEARRRLDVLLAEQRKRTTSDDPVMTETLRLLTIAVGRLQDHPTALRHAEEALNRHVAMYGEDNATGAYLLQAYASALINVGRVGESVQTRLRAALIGERRIGFGSTFMAPLYVRLGLDYRFVLHEPDQADRAFRRGIVSTSPEARLNLAILQMALGELLAARDHRFEAALHVETAYKAFHEIRTQAINRDMASFNLAWLAFRRYDVDKADRLLTPAAAGAIRDLGDNLWNTDRLAQLIEMEKFFGPRTGPAMEPWPRP